MCNRLTYSCQMQVVASNLDFGLAQYVHHSQIRTTPVRIDLEYYNADSPRIYQYTYI